MFFKRLNSSSPRKKFCCDRFQIFYSGDKTYGLNIRIVKLTEEFIKRAQLKFDKSFLITEGYTDNIEECKKKMVITYCPFCGEKLSDWYSGESYVQEIMEG